MGGLGESEKEGGLGGGAYCIAEIEFGTYEHLISFMYLYGLNV
jgi:hypothetical protein